MLWVSKTGARTWVQRIRYDGKRHDIGLGGCTGRESEKRKAKEVARKRITFAEATRKAHAELSPT